MRYFQLAFYFVLSLLVILTHSFQQQQHHHGKRQRRFAWLHVTPSSTTTTNKQKLARAITSARTKAAKTASTSATANSIQPLVDRDTATASLSNTPPLGNLRRLTQVIDETLAKKRLDASCSLENTKQTRDSMAALVSYNENYHYNNHENQHQNEHENNINHNSNSNSDNFIDTLQVMVVFGKPLIGDEITVEYASRVQRLVQLFKTSNQSMDNNNINNINNINNNTMTPHVICFCGGTSRGNHISTAGAGLVFFQHLIRSQGIQLPPMIEFFLDRSAPNEGQALQNIVSHLKQTHLLTTTSTNTTNKLIHFTLISTDYHLCNMNDIHRCSPNQSLLRPLLRRNFKEMTQIIQPVWSFRYSTYPYKQMDCDAASAYLGKWFVLNEQLLPLLLNMRGVVEDKEFFQRENFNALASIRRTLVALMEDLYTMPELQMKLRQRQPPPSKSFSTSTFPEASTTVDVILEGALLCLGRCIDLVRPAGLHVGPVSKLDYSKALKSLEQCMGQIRAYCDPDQPLAPSEWGKLSTASTIPSDWEMLTIPDNEEDEPMQEDFISLKSH